MPGPLWFEQLHAISAGSTLTHVGTVEFASTAGNVTFGMETNGAITASAPSGGTAGGTWAGTNGAITGGSITVNTSGVSVALPAYLTTAANSTHSHALATTSTTGALVVVGTSNSNGATVGVPAFLTTAANSTHTHSQYLTTAANSTHTHGALALTNLTGTSASNGLSLSSPPLSYLTAGANITLSTTGSTVSIIGGAGAGGGIAVAAGGTTQSTGTVNFANSNGLTFGLSNNGTLTGSFVQSQLTAGSNITLSTTGSTISIIGVGAAPNRSYIEIMNGERLTRPWNISASQFSNRPIFQPFWLDGGGLIPSTVRVFWSWVTNTHPPVITMGAAIYELANSTQLTKVAATTQTLNFGTTASAQYTGNRAIDITGMTDSLAEGRKVLAVLFSAANTTNMNASLWGGDNFPNVLGFIAGGGGTTATNNTKHIFPFWGVYTANSGTFPDSVGATQINGGRSADLIDLYAVLKEI